MTKYLEELKPGDTFENENNKYILTIDYKKDGSKSCINLINTNNNFSPIVQKDNAPSINQNTNIS
jgi:hypothetical protein